MLPVFPLEYNFPEAGAIQINPEGLHSGSWLEYLVEVYKWNLARANHKRQFINLSFTFSWLCFTSAPFLRIFINDSYILDAHLEIMSVIHVTQFQVKCWRIGPRLGRFWWRKDKITELSFCFHFLVIMFLMNMLLTSLSLKLSCIMCRKRYPLTIQINRWVHMCPQS